VNTLQGTYKQYFIAWFYLINQFLRRSMK